MRRSALIAAATLVTALATATSANAAVVRTHEGAHYYSRTIPKPCFANRPAIHPHRLALGCNCPLGETVQKPSSAALTVHAPHGTGGHGMNCLYTILAKVERPWATGSDRMRVCGVRYRR